MLLATPVSMPTGFIAAVVRQRAHRPRRDDAVALKLVWPRASIVDRRFPLPHIRLLYVVQRVRAVRQLAKPVIRERVAVARGSYETSTTFRLVCKRNCWCVGRVVEESDFVGLLFNVS